MFLIYSFIYSFTSCDVHVAGIRIAHLAFLAMKTGIKYQYQGSVVLKSHTGSSAYTCIAHPEMAQTRLEATHSDLSEGGNRKNFLWLQAKQARPFS